MSNEIAVIAIAIAQPGLEPEIESAIRRCVTETRKEAGCFLYTVHTDLDQPNRFVFFERWASRGALSAHEREPHFLQMAKVFETGLIEPLQVYLLRAFR
jgi:quinol monooxygenase YgiN